MTRNTMRKKMLIAGIVLILSTLMSILMSMVVPTKISAAETFQDYYEERFEVSQGDFWVNTAFFPGADVNNQYVTTKVQTGGIDTVLSGDASLQLSKLSLTAGSEVILGGSQAGKLVLNPFFTYRVSFNMRLDNVSNFKMRMDNIPMGAYADFSMDYGSERVWTANNGYFNDDLIDSSVRYMEDGSGSGSFFNIAFTFRAKQGGDSNLVFLATAKENGTVKITLDDFIVLKQRYVAPVPGPMDELISTDFDNNFDFTKGEFVGRGTDLVSHELISTASGKKALKLVSSVGKKQMLMTTKKTASDEIMGNDLYKYYQKFAFSGLGKIFVEVKSYENDSVVYDLAYDLKTNARIESVGDPLQDMSSLIRELDVFYMSGQFRLTETPSYIEVYVDATDSENYLTVYDVTILKSQPAIERPTENPPLPEKYGENGKTLKGTNNLEAFVKKNSGLLLGGLIGLAIGVAVGVAIYIVVVKTTKKQAKKVFLSIGCVLLAVVFGGTASLISYRETGYAATVRSDSQGDYTYVYPEKVGGKLDNLGLGWVSLENTIFGGHSDLGNSGLLPEITNMGVQTSWAHIEKEEGVYDFSLCDEMVDFWTKQGKGINLRICTDTLMLPQTYVGVPQWLVDKYNIPFEERFYYDGGPVPEMKLIDTRDPNYREAMGKFLQALCDHYKDNSYVFSVEILGFGVWGEWHSGHSFDSLADRMTSLQWIVQEYADTFKDSGMDIMVSAAWEPEGSTPDVATDDYQEYVMWSALDYEFRIPGTTIRRNSGANLMRWSTDERIMSDAFRSGKRVPLYGEFSCNVQNCIDELYGYNFVEAINEIMFKMRANYSTVLGWANSVVAGANADGWTDIWDRANEKMGYRLTVDKARIPNCAKQGQTVTVMTQMSNSGVGIYPRNHDLAIFLLDNGGKVVHTQVNENTDLRCLIEGEITNIYTDLVVPESLKDGDYTIGIGILNEQGKPSIQFGMAGDDDNDRIYELGNMQVGKSAPTRMERRATGKTIDSVQFEPNTTYQMTFFYTPLFDVSRFYFGDYGGYVFGMTSEKGGEGATVGYYKWQDVSGEMGQKTVTFTTGNFRDYRANFINEDYADIVIHDVYIEKVGGYSETFEGKDGEGYDFLAMDAIYMPNSAIATLETKTPISGGHSVKVNARGDGYINAMKIDSSVFEWKPNTSYTVSFKYKPLTDVGKGGYFSFTKVDDEKSRYVGSIGEFYERYDTPYAISKTYTFLTDNAVGYTMAWGGYNSGEYLVDDIIITENQTGNVTQGESYGFERNEIPRNTFVFGEDTEDFESKSFMGSSFDWGTFAWGKMTYDPQYVISGESSLLGYVERADYADVWFEYAWSKTNIYQLKQNTQYRITFRYKIINYPDKNGFFNIFLRTLTGGVPKDIPVGNGLIEGQPGVLLTYENTFTTGEYADYSVRFGMHQQGGAIVVDDIFIDEVI